MQWRVALRFHVPHVFWRVQPTQPPCRVSSESATAAAYRPLWSTEILAELDRTLRALLAKRGASAEETDAYLTRLFRQMRITFPDALLTEWEELIPTIHLPDPDDRHVVAAARAGRADVIVTDNLADPALRRTAASGSRRRSLACLRIAPRPRPVGDHTHHRLGQ